MRAPAVLVLVAWLAGCANVAVVASSGGGAAATTTTTGLSVSATYAGSPSPAAWAWLTLALIAFDQAGPASAPTPPLQAGRQVNEVDCTKPIADWSANLRCK